jgi:prevent-host-death family protein
MTSLPNIYSSSKARENFYRLIDEVSDSHRPYVITGRRNNVIMISEEDYRAMEETLYLLSVPGMRESLLSASAEPIEDCLKADQINWDDDENQSK